MTSLTSVSTLMQNQKAASPLPPQSLFQAAQTSTGEALFFSIGDDGVFYLAYPQAGALTGWASTALSADFAALHGGRQITARTFDVGQDASSGAITVAVTVRAAGDAADTLYVMAGLPDAPDASWYGSASARPWLARAWDGPSPQPALDVAYLYVAAQTPLVAGVRQPGTAYIQNYTVSTSAASDAWAVLPTAENYDTMLDRGLGRALGSLSDGLYELYTLGGAASLLFTPLRQLYGPPPVTKLIPPAGALSFATVPGQGGTDLYAAGTGGLFRWSVAQQTPLAAGTQVVADPLFSGATSVRAHATTTEVVVWGLNALGQVFLTRCPRGSEDTPAAWSVPLPIASGVLQLASFLNQVTGANELFAHTQGQNIQRLTQDPVTSMWRQDPILLPALDPSDVVDFYSYTTQVTVTDADNLPLGAATLQLSATSPVGVYANHQYVRLSATPVPVAADADGTLTLVQQTATVGAVAYFLQAPGGEPQSVNPMAGPLAVMATVRDGAGLRAVQVSDGAGGTTPLVPASVSPALTDVVGSSLARFAQVAAALPQDGTVQPPPPGGVFPRASGGTAWGVVLAGGQPRYWEGAAGTPGVQGSAGTSDDPVETAAGDLLRWLAQTAEEVAQFFVNEVEGVFGFVVQVGGQLYRFALDTVNSVVQAAEFVFTRVEVLFDDLVKWVGFLFEWDDILRTHAVLRNVFQRSLESAAGSIATLRGEVTGLFDGLDQQIAGWSGLAGTGGTIRAAASVGQPAAQSSPEASWGVYHLKGSMAQATSSTAVVPGGGSTLEGLLAELGAAIARQETVFQNASDTLQTQIVAQLPDLTVGDVIVRLLGVLGEVLVESAENILVTLLDVLEILVSGVVGVMEAVIDIPVISPLYRRVANAELSLLDLMALVAAVPVTIVYKAANGAAPFPDTPFTSSLAAAPTLAALQALYAGGSQPAAAAEGEPSPEVQVLKSVMHFTAGYSSMAFFGLSIAKREVPASKTVSLLHGACFYFTTAPAVAAGILASPTPTWDSVMGQTVYSITAVQKLADAFSYQPGMAAWMEYSAAADLLLGMAGLVPPIAALARAPNASTGLGVLGGTAWNANRILTPAARMDPKVFLVKMGAVVVYGVTQLIMPVVTPLPEPLPTAAPA